MTDSYNHTILTQGEQCLILAIILQARMDLDSKDAIARSDAWRFFKGSDPARLLREIGYDYSETEIRKRVGAFGRSNRNLQALHVRETQATIKSFGNSGGGQCTILSSP